MLRFYGHFAAAIGTIVLVLLVAGIIWGSAGIQSRIDIGWFGLIGFPVAALIYAIIRIPADWRRDEEFEELHTRVASLEKKLQEHPSKPEGRPSG